MLVDEWNSTATLARMKKPSKPLDPWQVEDAKRLKNLFVQKAGMTQEEFGAKYEIGSQGMVWQYLNAHRPLNIRAAQAFATGLSVAIKDFSPGIAAEISAAAGVVSAVPPRESDFLDVAPVRRVDARASAGEGRIVFHEGERSAVPFRKDFLKELGIKEADAVVLYTDGQSMEPTLPDDSMLLVDSAKTTVQSGRVYVVRIDSELVVKRLRVNSNGGLRVQSDNPDKAKYPERLYSDGDRQDVQVLGRVRWVGFTL